MTTLKDSMRQGDILQSSSKFDGSRVHGINTFHNECRLHFDGHDVLAHNSWCEVTCQYRQYQGCHGPGVCDKAVSSITFSAGWPGVLQAEGRRSKKLQADI